MLGPSSEAEDGELDVGELPSKRQKTSESCTNSQLKKQEKLVAKKEKKMAKKALKASAVLLVPPGSGQFFDIYGADVGCSTWLKEHAVLCNAAVRFRLFF